MFVKRLEVGSFKLSEYVPMEWLNQVMMAEDIQENPQQMLRRLRQKIIY